MNNKIKRLLSFVIAVMLIIQPTFSNTVYASEIEDNMGESSTESEDEDVQEASPGDAADSQDDIQCINASDLKYRLVVAASDQSILTDGYVISGYEGIYIIGYLSEEERMTGYEYYRKTADFAEYDDEIFEVADDDMTDENEAEVTDSDDALTILSDMEASDISGESKVIAVIDTGDNGRATDAVSVIGDDTQDDNGHGSMVIDTIISENPDA